MNKQGGFFSFLIWLIAGIAIGIFIAKRYVC